MAITFLIIEIFGCFKMENEALNKKVLTMRWFKFSSNILSAKCTKINVMPIIPCIQYFGVKLLI